MLLLPIPSDFLIALLWQYLIFRQIIVRSINSIAPYLLFALRS
jgi:hypothetical protein